MKAQKQMCDLRFGTGPTCKNQSKGFSVIDGEKVYLCREHLKMAAKKQITDSDLRLLFHTKIMKTGEDPSKNPLIKWKGKWPGNETFEELKE